jgi:hypothetical protein
MGLRIVEWKPKIYLKDLFDIILKKLSFKMNCFWCFWLNIKNSLCWNLFFSENKGNLMKKCWCLDGYAGLMKTIWNWDDSNLGRIFGLVLILFGVCEKLWRSENELIFWFWILNLIMKFYEWKYLNIFNCIFSFWFSFVEIIKL